MKIVFFGTSDFGVPALEALRTRHSVLAVVSTPDKPSGRRLQLSASPVKEWARVHAIPIFEYLRDDPGALLTSLKEMRPDLFLVISFGALLKSDYLTATRYGSLNVHASLLPKHRGASPMQSSILAGDPESGVSVMRMIERLDAGDVMLQKKISLGADEDLLSLKRRLSVLGAEGTLEALDQLERGLAKFTVQDDRVTSYAKKIKKEDGRIDWNADAKTLHARVRALLGWPGSFTFLRGKRLLILQAKTGEAVSGKKPGTVLEAKDGGALSVACGHGSSLLIFELQLEGKKAMSWREFQKGFPIRPGDTFENL